MSYKPNDAPPEDRDCPTPESVIDQFLKVTKYRKPTMFPADHFQAARYWMAHQAQPDQYTEGATPPVTKGGSWGTPYHDRLIYSLRRFLRMKAIEQVYIIEHTSKGVPWKGESIDHYTIIVKEEAKMAVNKEKYIDDGFEAMRRAAKAMTV